MPDSVLFTNEPAPEVLGFFRGKTLQPSFDWRDVWGDEHASAFTVAKATKLDVLEAIRTAVDDAIAQGKTFEQFQAEIEPELKRLGWWGKQTVVDPKTGREVEAQLGSPRRLQTIYSANIRSANAAGVWERAQRVREVLPYFIYKLGPSIVHRPHHVARENMVFPVDHPIWDAWFPPNGWGCKCWVLQVNEEDARAAGYDERLTPLIQTKGWINRRTGRLEQIPIGIDPGWHRNPGKFREENLRSFLADRLETAPKALRKAAVADTIGNWLFRRIQSGEYRGKGSAPVAVLGEAQAAELGTGRTVWFTTDAAAAQRARANLQAADYAVVQSLIDGGASATHEGSSLIFIGLVGRQRWRATVQADGAESRLVTLERIGGEVSDLVPILPEEEVALYMAKVGEKAYREAAQALGVTREEAPELLRAKLTALLEGVEPWTRVRAADLKRILEDGRMKSQFEAGKSQGLFNTDYRRRVEQKLFGVHKTLPDEKRPIYGYLTRDGDGRYGLPGNEFWLHQYGDVALKLKREARSRVTFTTDDSFQYMGGFDQDALRGLPSALNVIDERVVWDGHISSLEALAKAQIINDIAPHYIEAQVWGGLRVTDIDEVVFYKPAAYRRYGKLLRERGLKVRLSRE